MQKFSCLGDLLFWSYSNAQMLSMALGRDLSEYDRECFMLRAKAYKAYRDGRWRVHDLSLFNLSKVVNNGVCWYCGRDLPPQMLTADHVFPRAKGGTNDFDNIILVCKSCNSSKGKRDLFRWFFDGRGEWPSLSVLVHYLKNIILFCQERALMDVPLQGLDTLSLPFDWRFIPLNVPQPCCSDGCEPLLAGTLLDTSNSETK